MDFQKFYSGSESYMVYAKAVQSACKVNFFTHISYCNMIQAMRDILITWLHMVKS